MAFGGRMHLSIRRKPPWRPGAPRLPQKGDESGQINSASHGPRTATPQGTQAPGSSGPLNPRCGVSRPETCPPPRPVLPQGTIRSLLQPAIPRPILGSSIELCEHRAEPSGRPLPDCRGMPWSWGKPLRPRGTQAHSGLALPHQGPAADTQLRLQEPRR